MEISHEALEDICRQIGSKLGIVDMGLHVAAVFQDDDHNEVIGWAVLTEDNTVISTYWEIEELFAKWQLKNNNQKDNQE